MTMFWYQKLTFYLWYSIDGLKIPKLKYLALCVYQMENGEDVGWVGNCVCLDHKVLTYVEYRAVSGVFQNIYSTQQVCPHPAPKAGGKHSPGVEGGGGSIFWKTHDIGLASYTVNSLWFSPFFVILQRVRLNNDTVLLSETIFLSVIL